MQSSSSTNSSTEAEDAHVESTALSTGASRIVRQDGILEHRQDAIRDGGTEALEIAADLPRENEGKTETETKEKQNDNKNNFYDFGSVGVLQATMERTQLDQTYDLLK